MEVSCKKVVGNSIASNQHMEEAREWEIHSFFFKDQLMAILEDFESVGKRFKFPELNSQDDQASKQIIAANFEQVAIKVG